MKFKKKERMKVRILSILVVLLVFASCIKKQVEGVQVIDVATYEKQLKQPDVQLIDARTPEEFSQGHIENAKNANIMGEDFDAQVTLLDRSKPVMVYCKSGSRSAKASERLKELGFTNITDLEGGITSWNSGGKPIVK
jgi:rhodanese-related sulfurtransferase